MFLRIAGLVTGQSQGINERNIKIWAFYTFMCFFIIRSVACFLAVLRGWREVLTSCTTGVVKTLQKLVEIMPDTVVRFLDQLVTETGDRQKTNYKGILVTDYRPVVSETLATLRSTTARLWYGKSVKDYFRWRHLLWSKQAFPP
ncbi:uncharacterized protein [Acropora muricata]|uniref:uncharacterized protein isoform X3 n=1 Tax=Acropora muricata TaxID=159855 RepID=UPI0034E55A8F